MLRDVDGTDDNGLTTGRTDRGRMTTTMTGRTDRGRTTTTMGTDDVTDNGTDEEKTMTASGRTIYTYKTSLKADKEDWEVGARGQGLN